MKIILVFTRPLLCLLAIITITQAPARAQQHGILPLTGMRFFNEGISAKAITVNIDGARLLSNRIPMNKEMEVNIDQPAGFTADMNKTIFAGAEISLLSPKGEQLVNVPNVLSGNLSNGFDKKNQGTLNLKFGIAADQLKGNFNGILKIRVYDLKSKNQLRLEIPVSFAKPGESLQVSKTVKTISSIAGAVGVINGLQAKAMQVNLDTSIKVSPKMAYTSIDIPNIEGSSISGIFEGKENFWVYDSDLNEVKITDILLKQVKGALENNSVNYTLKIPFRLKTNLSKPYTVRYRWESPDKKQVIDVVVNI